MPICIILLRKPNPYDSTINRKKQSIAGVSPTRQSHSLLQGAFMPLASDCSDGVQGIPQLAAFDKAKFTLIDKDFQKHDKMKMDSTVIIGFETINKNQHEHSISRIRSGKAKGFFVTESTINNLKDIFPPYDRPLISRNLDITIPYPKPHDEIIVLQSKKSIFNYVSYLHDLESILQILSWRLTRPSLSSR